MITQILKRVLVSLKILFKNKYFLYIITLLIIWHLIIVLYRPVVNEIKYLYISKKIEYSINNTAEKILEKRIDELKYEKLQKLREIEKEYILKQTELETNYNNIVEDSINKNKNILREQLDNWYEISTNIVGKIDLLYKSNFYEALINKDISNIIFNEYDNLFKINKTEAYVFNDINVDKFFNNINNEVISSNEEEKSILDQQKNQNPTNFNLEIKDKLESWIIIYDKTKYENILNYWITFPSFFSYKLNWIRVPSDYYDIHYGVDYKTKPLTYIDIKFFNDKVGTIYKAFNDSYGKRIYITTENERFEYLHLNKIYLKEWDKVLSDTIIAQTGNSWLSTWPHLHFSYIKNGFYIPFDWWMDFDNKTTLLKMWLREDEANEFIKLWENDIINMESVLGLYMDISDKKFEDIKNIKEIIKKEEEKWNFSLNQILLNDYFKWRIWNKWVNFYAWNAREIVDKFHSIKKEMIMNFLLQNIEVADEILYFPKEKIGGNFTKKITNNNNNNENNKRINLWVCSDYNSIVYSKYWDKIISNDLSFLQEYAIDNINKLVPLIIDEIDKNDILSKIKEKTNDKVAINKCDILLIELWKWYQEHTFYLDNPNKWGIFQNMSQNYYDKFPSEKWNPILSEEQYRTQIRETLLFSIWKLSYLSKSVWNEKEDINDYLLKYWLWSYHGLVWKDPNKNYYIANNLLYSDLPLNDQSATRKTAYKDWWFTIATKIYLNFIKK